MASQQAPRRRPAMMSELVARAQETSWDENGSFKYFLRLAEKYRKDAKESVARGELEDAFIAFARSASIVVEKLPGHRDYSTALNLSQKNNLSLNGKEILDNLDHLKPILLNRFDQWSAQHPDYEDSPPPPSAVESQQQEHERIMGEEARKAQEEADMARRRQQQQQQQPPPTSFAASSAVLSAKATGIAASQDIGLMNQRQQRQEMHEEERKQIEVEARRMEQQKRQEEERKRTETEKAEVEDEYHHSSIERNKPRLPIIKEVLDHHGQTQARLSCFLSGIWSVNSSNNPDVFTVNFDDPTFKDVLKHPWDHPEWSMPSRINILLELLYWETKLSTTPDVFQFELFRCIHRIARKYEMIPPSLYLRDLVKEGNDQVWGGGYADIYQGRTVNGELACLKVLRVFTTLESSKQLFKEFSQEVLVWSQLEHPNILPFLGINMDLFPGRYCLVSPWCGHGSVMNYLSMHPEVDKMEIIKDILIGLQYLHTRNPPVVHGDLKGANILVSERRRCCLADFGLAGMNTLQTLSSASGNPRGSTRWMAPELFDYTITSRPSMSTDMYALGCTTLEIFTGAPPFSEIKHDAAVTFRVMNGFRPSRPAQGFTDGLWQAVERCWVHFNDRPSIQGFLYEFERIT